MEGHDSPEESSSSKCLPLEFVCMLLAGYGEPLPSSEKNRVNK